MKKIISGFVLVVVALALVACGEWEGPPGFDYTFHSDAKETFTEFDDDTSEGESPDRDDLGNFNRLKDKADTPEEEAYLAQMDLLILENEKIVKDVKYSTATYEDIREEISNILDIRIYEFEFTEAD